MAWWWVVHLLFVIKLMHIIPSFEGGNTRDRVLWTKQGAFVGVVVKIVSDEQERPTILGTTRGHGPRLSAWWWVVHFPLLFSM